MSSQPANPFTVSRPWTEDDNARLRDLWERQGASTAAIADALGRTAKAVQLRAYKLGLQRPPDAPSRQPAVALMPAPPVIPSLVVSPAPPTPTPADAERADVDFEFLLDPIRRLMRLGIDAERLRRVTTQQAALIVAYQEALDGDTVVSRPSPPVLLRPDPSHTSAIADLQSELDHANQNRTATEHALAVLETAHADLDRTHADLMQELDRRTSERDRLLSERAALNYLVAALEQERDALAKQLATPSATGATGGADDKRELRRAWLVLAWTQKAVGTGRAMHRLTMADESELSQEAHRLAEAGRLVADGTDPL